MAALELQGAHVGVYFRDNGTTQTWKKLTCEQTLVFDMTNDVTIDKTKCGIFKGILIPPDCKFNGSGVANLNPAFNEMSFDQLQNDQNAGNKKDFRIQNEAYGAIGLSDQFQINGSGYFTVSQVTANNGETVKFTYTFEVVGTVITAES